jgi:hypothetical protein
MKSFTVTAFAALLSVATAQNCTVFNWNQQRPYLLTYPPQRISGASTCPPSSNTTHSCPLVASGDGQYTFSYNISSVLRDAGWNTGTGSETFMHNLIYSAVNGSLNETGTPVGWNTSVIGVLDTVYPLSPNTSAYLNFTAYKRCFAGTMSNCTGGLQDGVAIEACAPVYHTTERSNGGRAILDGNYTLQEVPEANVTQYSDPFANQVRPSNWGAKSFGASSGAAVMVAGLAVVFALAM